MLSGEATNTNFIAFGLNLPGLEPTIAIKLPMWFLDTKGFL
jgi:hypothetical protein